MEKHLGGVIHLIDSCDSNPDSSRIVLTTFRPNLISHLSEKKLSDETTPNRKRRKPQKRPKFDQTNTENRRIDVDYDEYDANDFLSTSLMNDATTKLVERCKERLRQKGGRTRYICKHHFTLKTFRQLGN
jgi:hypothetical protein